MFYAHYVLAKKGPLARIWLAAHWDKKLTKAHVFETNIEKSVDGILQPKVKMALRTSGHLLLGVVRIYSRKAKYLLADCNEAFVKIKMAFRPGMVDLPEEHREAAVTAITLPEVFHDFDAMPELKDVDIEAQFSLNQSRAEEITMREDYGSLALVTHDQGFGDMSFDAEPPELLRHAGAIEPSLDQSHMLFTDGPGMEPSLEQKEKEPVAGTSATPQAMDIDTPIRDDGFGGHLGQDIISGGLFEGGLFDEAPMGEVPVPEVSSISEHQETGAAAAGALPSASVHDESDEDMGDHFGGPASPMGGMSSDGSRAATPAALGDEMDRFSVASRRFTPAPPAIAEEHAMDGAEEPAPLQEQTTLLHDEEESFALAPVDASALRGFTKAKRKRKLIVDEVKNISGEEMKAQLSDTSDIVTTLDLAPPTKRLMHWKETGGVEKLFALPGRPIPARVLFKNYQRHLTSKSYDHEDFGKIGEDEGMPLEQVRDGVEPETDQNLSKRLGRKRKAQPEEDTSLTESTTSEQPVPAPSAATISSEALQVPPLSQIAIPPATPLPASASPVPEVSLPAEPSVPDISGLVPSVLADQSVAEDVQQQLQLQPEAEVTAMSMEMPQIPASEVSSLLETQPPIPEEPEPEPVPEPVPVPVSVSEAASQPPAEIHPSESVHLPSAELPQMENMGYDHGQPQVSYMGYDEQQAAVHTPGNGSERGPATPWNHEDYEFPPSVGPHEEQQVDETYEQFEERVLNKRAAHMYHVIKSKLETKERLTLSEMAYKNNRKQAAQKFYTLLVLKKFQVLELNQEYSYAEIIVTKGPKFENPAL